MTVGINYRIVNLLVLHELLTEWCEICKLPRLEDHRTKQALVQEYFNGSTLKMAMFHLSGAQWKRNERRLLYLPISLTRVFRIYFQFITCHNSGKPVQLLSLELATVTRRHENVHRVRNARGAQRHDSDSFAFCLMRVWEFQSKRHCRLTRRLFTRRSLRVVTDSVAV